MTKFRGLCGMLALLALLFAPTQVPAADATTELRNAIASQRALPRAPQLPHAAFLAQTPNPKPQTPNPKPQSSFIVVSLRSQN